MTAETPASRDRRLHRRTFYLIAASQTISLLGSTLAGLAVGIWVFARTGEVTPFAFVSLAGILPSILAGAHLGLLADRMNRRLVMAIADMGQATTTLLLLISFASGAFQLWHLYGLTLVSATFRFLQEPAFRAAITDLVSAEERTRANVIMEMQGPLAGVFAPALAGLLYALIGVEGALFVDLATFALAFTALLLVRFPTQPRQQDQVDSIWRQALAGWRFIFASRLFFVANLYFTFLNFIVGGVLTVLIQPYLLSRTGSESTMGLILSVMNISMIIGGVMAGFWKGAPRMRVILVGIFMLCLGTVSFGAARDATALTLVMAIFAIPITGINALSVSLWQMKVPPNLQGRFFAARAQSAMLLLPISYLFVGRLADQVFTPAVGKAGWSLVAPLVGNGAGAGMGLMIVIAGLIATACSLLALSSRRDAPPGRLPAGFLRRNRRAPANLTAPFAPEHPQQAEQKYADEDIFEGLPFIGHLLRIPGYDFSAPPYQIPLQRLRRPGNLRARADPRLSLVEFQKTQLQTIDLAAFIALE